MNPYDFPDLFEFVVVGTSAADNGLTGIYTEPTPHGASQIFIPYGTVLDVKGIGGDLVEAALEGKPVYVRADSVDWRPVLTGEELRHRREAAGLTQGGLAKLLGVELNTVSRWEIGTRAITAPGAVRLALELLEQNKSS